VSQASIDKASSAFKAGEFDNALRMFRKLRSQVTEPKKRLILQWNIGRCLEKKGQIAQAILVFEDYRKTVKDPVRAARAKAIISVLRKDQTGTIAVSCDRTDVSVSVEGINGSEGSCPRIIESISVGSYVLIGRRPDESMSRTMVTVKANETAEGKLLFGGSAIQPAQSKNWPWYVVGGTLLVAAGIATYFALSEDETKTNQVTRICFDDNCR